MNLLVQLERKLADRLATDAERRARRRALEIAMRRFAMVHPTWHEALFDEPFVRRVLAANHGQVDAGTLAREWTRQFRYENPRQVERDVRQLVPVAESMLRLLSEARDEVDPGRDATLSQMPDGHRADPAPC